jgi:leucyl/phenylalanyl-tRNA--protein transferase
MQCDQIETDELSAVLTFEKPVDPNQPIIFPDPNDADSRGLVAVGGDLSVDQLLNAYRRGLFPWTVHPVTWWSPDPRAIIELNGLHVSRSLLRVIHRSPFLVTWNKAFREVITNCAVPGPNRRGVWITPEFIEAYTRLHEQGHAHSVECWQDSKLVGGIYGVAIGGFFAGESMFHRVSNASKVALYYLMKNLRERGFELFDIQMVTPGTQPLGAVEISRRDYLQRLESAAQKDCRF